MRSGDTLQSIAQGLYGDGALWYKLAEANGMAGPVGLIEGQRLVLPTGVVKTVHNAGTLNPYDPAETIGDLVPDTKPQAQEEEMRRHGRSPIDLGPPPQSFVLLFKLLRSLLQRRDPLPRHVQQDAQPKHK